MLLNKLIYLASIKNRRRGKCDAWKVPMAGFYTDHEFRKGFDAKQDFHPVPTAAGSKRKMKINFL